MTIECQETRFGRPVGELHAVEPGTYDWLWLKYVHRTFTGEALRVDGPWRVTVTYVSSLGAAVPHVLVREEINKQNLQTSPMVNIKDFFLWRRRHYSWRDDDK